MTYFNRLVITGAAGSLGSQLRRGLAPLAEELRLHDRAPIENPSSKEEVVEGELSDFESMLALTRDADAVVHFGGVPREHPWAEVLDSNIVGSYNVYEACRRNGVKRVVYASSIHVVGFARREDCADTFHPHLPDSLYGLSKCFVEDLGRLYYDKFGIESVMLRINSCFPEPTDRRMLGTWLSFRDLVHLTSRALLTERVGFSVIYGISDNHEYFLSNRRAHHLGYRPQDSAETYRAKVESAVARGDPEHASVKFVGGKFCSDGHPDDSLSG